ncbi:hypothetical protein M0R45_009944 [Rubus argutus]|uniref:F-box domain-containing protein n=1 Tax=Rubus argutus TaxID=59490 RepID=A0AAW1Y9F4_RUBAR
MSKRKRQQHKYTYGCWQNPPEDIMEKIIQHLSLDDRLRLSFVCKHWQSFATRRDMRSAPQLPLLVLPHPPNCQVLSFASLSKGEVVCLNMPKPVRGVFFHTSSKAFFNNHGLGVDRQELGFCRPGDKRWIVFNYFDTCIGVKDILFSGNTLYALLLHNDDTKSGTVVAHTLTFGDHVVELKFIYDIEATMNRYVVHDSHNSYMLESSINNEVFLIHQMLDHTYPNPDPYQDIDQEDQHLSGTTRSDEMISIFYLDTGKIKRLFPDVDDLKGQKGWFTPSLW